MKYRILAIIIFATVTFIPSLNAQVLTEVFSRFDSLHNLSYKAIIETKAVLSDKTDKDTLVSSFILSKNKSLFKIAGNNVEEVYDGNKLIKMDLTNRTYRFASSIDNSIFLSNSIPYIVGLLKEDVKKNIPVNLHEDSIVNGEKYFHVTITERDTVMKGKRVYRILDLLIDKINYFPIYYRNEMQGFIDGTDILVDTYSEVHFYDYQINKEEFEDLSSFVIPSSFAIKTVRKKSPISIGSKAPELSLKDSKSDSFLLKKQIGKVVLLNFTSISCPHGLESVNMLNDIYSKYRSKNFALVTINPDDDKEEIELYNKKHMVKYPIFINTGIHNVDRYNVENYPTFYLIDTKGNIIKEFVGYYDSLGKELGDLIKKYL